MKKIAVFVSGGGTDLQSVIDAVAAGSLEAEIALVVSSKDGVFALERAKSAGIPTAVFKKSDYSSPEEMYGELIGVLKEKRADYVVLAGYLGILTPNIVHAFPKRIINIHPSLIPRHCGNGYYGIKVHRSVIESGDAFSGATVHFVDEGTDTGEIIMQEKIAVLPSDTAETLQKRVLELEHVLLPKALSKVLRN